MTYFQIASLLLAGPVALIMFAHLILAIVHPKGEFHIIQGFVLFLCVVVILVSFLGVK